MHQTTSCTDRRPSAHPPSYHTLIQHSGGYFYPSAEALKAAMGSMGQMNQNCFAALSTSAPPGMGRGGLEALAASLNANMGGASTCEY